MQSAKQIDFNTLRQWLDEHKKVIVLDVRPNDQRKEWQIPGSFYIDAYQQINDGDYSVLNNLNVPKDVPLITVCAAGRISQVVANELQKKGFDAYSLKNGMKGWSLAWNKAVLAFKEYEIIQLRRTGKGCLSYIIASDKEAIIVDASLPIEVYEKILQKRNWKLNALMETHIHADHLSRSKQIAEKFGVPLLLPTPNRVNFEYEEIKDGQTITVGNVSIKLITTPGHTIESICFLVNDEVLLTGDTLFTNAVGRPDLKANEEETKKRAELLYDSLQKILKLNDEIIVLPGHTSNPIDFDDKPIKAGLGEIKTNVPILGTEKENFVKKILEQLPPPPSNYLIIVEKNLSGNLSDVNEIDLEAGANRCAVS